MIMRMKWKKEDKILNSEQKNGEICKYVKEIKAFLIICSCDIYYSGYMI
jgi:hypothetical protein